VRLSARSASRTRKLAERVRDRSRGSGPAGATIRRAVTTMTESPNSWFDRVPKAELHVHLEGAIPLDALHELVRKYGSDEPLPDVQALRRKMVFRDFPHFLQVWTWKNGFLREYDEGAMVTVSTDNPAMFGTSLATEFAELERVHGLDPAEVRGLLLGAIDASWLSGDRKERLAAKFVADPHWYGRPPAPPPNERPRARPQR
jgi:adenosine deaminase